jgi:ATP-dependent DNA helicase RecQ
MNAVTNLAAIVLARDGYRCQVCGAACRSATDDVHPLLPDTVSMPRTPADYVTLCPACAQRHAQRTQPVGSQSFFERTLRQLAVRLDDGRALPDSLARLSAGLRVLGAARLRAGQFAVVLAALRGQSVLMVSPTGSGKTLCFQLPTLIQDRGAFVISPLKALMSEQVHDLQARQISSTFIHGDVAPADKYRRYGWLADQAVKFFYCTPERFDDTRVRADEVARLLAARPRYLVIDEAHCIDRWGDDFRPSYSRLGEIRQKLGNPTVLAFTATAGVKTQQRILQSLGIPEAQVVVTGVDRPNIALLRLAIEHDEARFDAITTLLNLLPSGRAMVFVPTIKVGERIQAGLRARGFDVPFYHSKIDRADVRAELLDRFMGRRAPGTRVILCTSAFGMGIDVPDVRLVIHWQHPPSVEDYLQEFGRAGRDRRQALAVLFRGANDTGLLRFMAEKTVAHADIEEAARPLALEAKLAAIDDMHQLATQRRGCLRAGILRYFTDDANSQPKSTGLRILEWLYEQPRPPARTTYCCDDCDRVTLLTYPTWVRAIFRRV